MEQLDRELQKRVWQRVQSREEAQAPQPAQDNLKALLLTAQENRVAYGQLRRQMGPKNRETLAKLQRQTGRSITCIQGICRLRGETGKVPQLPAVREPVRRGLEKCYHRERKLCMEWERRTGDPEYGPVFAQLAGQSREHCTTIMQMLGEMEK